MPDSSPFETSAFGFIAFILSLVNLLLNARFVGQYENGVYSGGIGPMATMLGFNTGISFLVFYGIMKIIGRRLNKDPTKRVLFDHDKTAFSWMMLTLTVNIIIAYSTEVYWN